MNVAWVLAGAIVCAGSAIAAPAATLIVHEWGTFTSFQDEQGRTIGGINVDDEPVPRFVHRLKDLPIFSAGSYPASWSQGAPRCHPDVTLRLETPVLYFYPQQGFAADTHIDVKASFAGGWLTEFYPLATADTPKFPHELAGTTRGSLEWTGLRLGDPGAPLAETDAPVWLAPRKVSAAAVTTPGNETEKYLFYRGVGHLEAPLTVRQSGGRQLRVALRESGPHLMQLPPSWLVRVLPDGKLRYRTLHAGAGRNEIVVDALANDGDGNQLDALRRELADALTAAGLFADEAQAMLETWKLSYFESEGVRLFFLLPQAWTDAQLPLAVSVPSKIVRVMMGRIELISDHQRSVLSRLHDLDQEALNIPPLYLDIHTNRRPVPPATWSERQEQALARWRAGLGSHADFYRGFGLEVPEALHLYDSLGRFRDALLAHELATTTDAQARTRLRRIMSTFSACLPQGVP